MPIFFGTFVISLTHGHQPIIELRYRPLSDNNYLVWFPAIAPHPCP